MTNIIPVILDMVNDYVTGKGFDLEESESYGNMLQWKFKHNNNRLMLDGISKKAIFIDYMIDNEIHNEEGYNVNSFQGLRVFMEKIATITYGLASGHF
jgi:hypothetical protein